MANPRQQQPAQPLHHKCLEWLWRGSPPRLFGEKKRLTPKLAVSDEEEDHNDQKKNTMRGRRTNYSKSWFMNIISYLDRVYVTIMFPVARAHAFELQARLCALCEIASQLYPNAMKIKSYARFAHNIIVQTDCQRIKWQVSKRSSKMMVGSIVGPCHHKKRT